MTSADSNADLPLLQGTPQVESDDVQDANGESNDDSSSPTADVPKKSSSKLLMRLRSFNNPGLGESDFALAAESGTPDEASNTVRRSS